MAWVALLLLGGAVACVPGADPTSSDAQGISSGSPGDAAIGACSQVDLRTPTGERIDLTGTWETEKEGTREGVYFLRQAGDCLWWSGGYADTNDDVSPPYYQINVFRGTIGTDFTVGGEWTDLRQDVLPPPGSGGTIVLRMEFTTAGEIRLVYVGGSGQPFIEPGYREQQSWIRVSDAGASLPPSSRP